MGREKDLEEVMERMSIFDEENRLIIGIRMMKGEINGVREGKEF